MKAAAFINPDALTSRATFSNDAEALEILQNMLPIENHDNSTILINGGKYRCTGIVKLYQNEMFNQQTVYLKVSKVEAI